MKRQRYNLGVLKRRAAELGVTYSRLALAAQVSAPTVYRLMRGEGSNPRTVKRVADAMGVEMADLIIRKTQKRKAAASA